ncbi:MAG: acriflavin resistance protein [Chlorobiaceae bacterium]|nr:acriflavin resistance protein [Chlorobiaceae bacterium]MBA4310755.1 acriflavin resistance protein [Chlorobiaceae bacterium]
MTITELSIKRPILVVVLFMALTVMGAFSFNLLKYELLPSFSVPFVTVTTVYPGSSPNEVETSVTKVIEDAVSGMDKVKSIRATSFEGLSFVIIELGMDADVDISMQNAQRKIGEVLPQLPDGSERPVVSKFALDEIPILRMGATSSLASTEFYEFLENQIRPQLSRVSGVGQVVLIGGEEREIKVNVDRDKLRAHGIPLLQVTNAIRASNMDFPAGNIKEPDEQFVVRVAGKFNSLDELRNLTIGVSRTGGEIKLSSVAEVEDGLKDFATMNRVNNKISVGVNVQKQTDANTVDVAEDVKTEIHKLEEQYKNINLKFDIAQDASIFTIAAANAVKKDLLIVIVLVFLVMLIFLHSLRNSFIIMISIPTSMVSTFIAMYALDFTLNLMTLLGLSLVIAILVDDSIVVLENIYRHLEKGEDRKVAALKGRNEIGFAALAITLVDVAVFIPLALVTGLIGNITQQFALVVAMSTLMSLFVSFTVTPMLASRFAKVERLSTATIFGRFAIWFEEKFHNFTEHYITLLKWSFINKGKIAVAVIFLFIASLALVPLGFIGSEFISATDRGEVSVSIELPPGSKVEETNLVSGRIERSIQRIPEVEKTYTNVGISAEGLLGFPESNSSVIAVSLVDKNQRARSTAEVIVEIKEIIQNEPGVKTRVSPIGLFGVADETPIQIIVSGPNIANIQIGAEKIAELLKSIPGTTDVRLSTEQGKPETRIIMDRSKLAQYGLTLGEVSATLRMALTGDDYSKFREGNSEFDIRVRLDEFDRTKIDELARLTFMNRMGQQIELQQFATLEKATGPTQLSRTDRNPSILVLSQTLGRPTGSIGEDLKAGIANLDLPKDITISYDGDLKMQEEAFASLGLALIAAVLFSYLIMVALYNSFYYPFIILFSIPLAVIGALLALALSMKALSIFSLLGMIVMIGLVAKNAILLVDRTNAMREEGMPLQDALIDAGRMRMRPIFMTTLTLVFGLMPLAMSAGEGGEWKSALGWALIGGLTSSLFLTLIVVPLVYTKIEELRIKSINFFTKFRNKKEAEITTQS